MNPEFGLLTWKAEGQEAPGTLFHSRNPHVPTNTSGITLGRGYDLKQRRSADVFRDLVSIGIEEETAKAFSNGAGLSGNSARQYLNDNNLANYEITKQQQIDLFTISYGEARDDIFRIARKVDVVRAYGKVDFDALHPAILEVLIDLRYRGDYTGTSSAFPTRKHIQELAADNDLEGFLEQLSRKEIFSPNLTADRLNRRVDFLLYAVEEQNLREQGNFELNATSSTSRTNGPGLVEQCVIPSNHVWWRIRIFQMLRRTKFY